MDPPADESGVAFATEHVRPQRVAADAGRALDNQAELAGEWLAVAQPAVNLLGFAADELGKRPLGRRREPADSQKQGGVGLGHGC